MTPNRMTASAVKRQAPTAEDDLTEAEWREALAAYASRPADLLEQDRTLDWRRENGETLTLTFQPAWDGKAVTAQGIAMPPDPENETGSEPETEGRSHHATLTLTSTSKEFQRVTQYLKGEGPPNEERMRLASLALEEYEAEVTGLTEVRDEAYRLKKYDWAAGTEDKMFREAADSVRRIRTLLDTGIDTKR